MLNRPVPGPDGPHDGIVTRIRSFRGLRGTPPSLHLAVADLPDLRADVPWQSDRQAFGMAWNDAGQARMAAWGEAVERISGTMLPAADRMRYGSHIQLTREGVRALAPERLTLYSPRQYTDGVQPFRPFLPTSPVHWMPVRSLTRQEEIHVPAFLVHTGWPRVPKEQPEQLHAFPAVGGTAAGTSLEQALLAGLGEVVERDAAAVWWANAAPLPRLPLSARIRALLGPMLETHEVTLAHIDNDFAIPVLAACVRTRAEGWLTIGFAARADPEAAALKALAEAFGLQLTCRALDDPAAAAHIAGGFTDRRNPLKAWRQDRAYLNDYREDGRDGTELLCHQQLYLDRRAGDRAMDWIGRGPRGSWTQVPRVPGGTFGTLRARGEAAGHEVLYADLTTRQARAAGMRVVRVIVPGMIGTAPACCPYFGGRRVRDQGVTLGWRRTPLTVEQLNTFPMPHA
ncbi:YcaO-like family protein [Streptomyces sp. NPDC007896]|uniref:YcaO-like family protein n=1 Tax=Streptomyces sp. NPDC007896 TaxID=3364784 RepID=UPI0036EDCBB8